MFGMTCSNFQGWLICSWNALMVNSSHCVSCWMQMLVRSHWTSSLPIHGTLDMKNGQERKDGPETQYGKVFLENLRKRRICSKHLETNFALQVFACFGLSVLSELILMLVFCFAAVIAVVISALPGLCFSPLFFSWYDVNILNSPYSSRNSWKEPDHVPLNQLTMPHYRIVQNLSQRKSYVFPSKEPWFLLYLWID